MPKPLIGVFYSNIGVRDHDLYESEIEEILTGALAAGGELKALKVLRSSDDVLDPEKLGLALRELVAEETIRESELSDFDGIVFVASNDMVIAGMVLAALKMDIPSVFFLPEQSSMALVAEVMGLSSCKFLVGSVSPAEQRSFALLSGTKIVELAKEGATPWTSVTIESVEAAIRLAVVQKDSTDTALHLLAISRMLGYKIALSNFNRITHEVRGNLKALSGNLAPEGAVINRANFIYRRYAGVARVFDSEAEAIEAIEAQKINSQSVIVVRYQGPAAGLGMQRLDKLCSAISQHSLDVAVVTDGRVPGYSVRPVVGHVSPEAAWGGPIAFVRDGDIIDINLDTCQLTLKSSEGNVLTGNDFGYRCQDLRPPIIIEDSFLEYYSSLVDSASSGAVFSDMLTSVD